MSILARHGTWLGAVFVTIAAGILYFFTAARDIVVGDTPELMTAAATLGVAHAPGYPLFTMLGHFFSLIPFGSIPFRVNLLSVVCDSLTIGVVYLIAIRLVQSRIAAAITALVLAVNPVFWEWSLAAEVFPLNNLLAATLILLLVMWHEQPERMAVLIAAFFVAGLALTNHQTIILLAPAFCFVLWQQRRMLFARPGILAFGILVFALGLLPYAYVPWASAHHPAHNWGNVSSFHDLIGLILRRSYGSTRLVSTPGYTGGPPWPRLATFFVSFGWLGGLLICAGAIETYRSRRWYFWFALIALVFAGPFFVWITNLNVESAPSALFVLQRFFLLSQVALAPLMAFGLLLIAEVVARFLPSLSIFSLRLTAGVCLIAIGVSVSMNYRRIDQSRNSIARRFGEDVFALARPHSILLVSGDGFAFPLIYLHKVEHAGSGVTLIVLPMLFSDWHARQLRSEHPDLVIPFDRYDRQTKNLKALIEANADRIFAFVGTLGGDHSVDQDYWPYQQGLLTVIMPKSSNIPLETVVAENEQLLSRCHPPPATALRMNTFEADILKAYTYPPFNIADTCERAGLKDAARTWYQRALAINPRFSQAWDALARLEH
jgi:hypothetical protein